MAKKKAFVSPDAPAPIGPYAQAVRGGKFVFLSGQIPLDPATGELVSGDIRAETRRVLDNLRAVLEAADSSAARVVKTTVYLTDLADFPAVNEVYAEYFGESPRLDPPFKSRHCPAACASKSTQSLSSTERDPFRRPVCPRPLVPIQIRSSTPRSWARALTRRSTPSPRRRLRRSADRSLDQGRQRRRSERDRRARQRRLSQGGPPRDQRAQGSRCRDPVSLQRDARGRRAGERELRGLHARAGLGGHHAAGGRGAHQDEPSALRVRVPERGGRRAARRHDGAQSVATARLVEQRAPRRRVQARQGPGRVGAAAHRRGSEAAAGARVARAARARTSKNLLEPTPGGTVDHPFDTEGLELAAEDAKELAKKSALLHAVPEFRGWAAPGPAVDELLAHVGETLEPGQEPPTDLLAGSARGRGEVGVRSLLHPGASCSTHQADEGQRAQRPQPRGRDARARGAWRR